MSTATERVQAKVSRILDKHGDDAEAADRGLYDALDANEILTVAMLPINSRLRNTVVAALRRDKSRQRDAARLKDAAREDELVPVEVHGGGKCKITIYMTKDALERQRS